MKFRAFGIIFCISITGCVTVNLPKDFNMSTKEAVGHITQQVEKRFEGYKPQPTIYADETGWIADKVDKRENYYKYEIEYGHYIFYKYSDIDTVQTRFDAIGPILTICSILIYSPTSCLAVDVQLKNGQKYSTISCDQDTSLWEFFPFYLFRLDYEFSHNNLANAFEYMRQQSLPK